MDELLVDEGDKCKMYDKDVGYIFGKFTSSLCPFFIDRFRALLMYATLRLKVQTHFRSFTFTSVQHFS